MIIRCRTCWEERNLELCTDITKKLDMLTFCVPRMSRALKEDDKICSYCVEQLNNCFHFITRCNTIEDNLLKIAQDIEDAKKNNIVVEKIEEPNSIYLPIPEEPLKQNFDIKTTDEADKLSDNSDVDIKRENFEYSDTEDEEILEDESKKPVNLNCSICNKIYHSKERFRKHHFTHTTNEDLCGCPVCKLIFNSLQSYEEHIKKEHSNSKLYKCEKCNKRFLRKCTYQRHKQLFRDTESCKYTCGRCKKFFFRKIAYKKHLEEVRDAPVCDFQQCSMCLSKFSKEDFKDHMNVHKSNIMCEVCGKSFSSKRLLYCHKTHIHTDPNSFICPHCGKGCKNKRYYNDHLRTHQNLSLEDTHKYICDKCPRRFTHKYRLDHHQKQHDNIRDFPCQYCDKSFCTKGAVNQHTRLVHLKVQPYVCSFCKKTFGRKDYLTAHLFLHTGEPRLNRKKEPVVPRKKLDESGKVIILNQLPKALKAKNQKPRSYICKFCKKEYKDYWKLKSHYRAHMNIRTYKCKFCELTFVNMCSRIKHEKLHNDPTYKFRCPICYKRKTSEEELKQHMMVHTKKPYKCEICPEAFARQYLQENHMANVHSEIKEINSKKLKEAIEDTAVVFYSDGQT